MNKEVKDKWVAALRSKKYKQAKETLTDLEGGFCCLGVLCDISGMSEWNEKGEYLDDDALLPKEVRMWADMQSCTGSIPIPVTKNILQWLDNHEEEIETEFTDLVGMNDSGHFTFNEIADVIEEHWESL